MAPTEILAEQHLKTIADFLGDMPVRVELLTGIVKGKKRNSILAVLAAGKTDLYLPLPNGHFYKADCSFHLLL